MCVCVCVCVRVRVCVCLFPNCWYCLYNVSAKFVSLKSCSTNSLAGVCVCVCVCSKSRIIIQHFLMKYLPDINVILITRQSKTKQKPNPNNSGSASGLRVCMCVCVLAQRARLMSVSAIRRRRLACRPSRSPSSLARLQVVYKPPLKGKRLHLHLPTPGGPGTGAGECVSPQKCGPDEVLFAAKSGRHSRRNANIGLA